MRVAFLAPDIDLSGLTGDAWHVKDIVTALGTSGCIVDLVVAGPVDWVGPPSVRIRPTPPGSFLRAALDLARAFRGSPPDVIYERRGSPKLSATLSRMLDRPYLVEINGLVEEEMLMQGRADTTPPWLTSAKLWARGQLLRSASGIVTVTEGLRRAMIEMHRIPSHRVHVVPNGVDLNQFRPLPRDEARADIGVRPGTPIIVFVGNLVAWQGIPILLHAMAHVRTALPDAILVLVGDGQERVSLKKLTEDLNLQAHVKFVGQVPRNRVPRYIAAADVAVMPSTLQRNLRVGSSALKLREYLACGRPVVATNIEGAGPFLEEHGVGMGVRGDDPIELARGLLTLLRDRDLRYSMGNRARALAERELSWDRAARRLVFLFEQVRSKSPGG